MSDTFCMAPWNHLQVDPEGTVKLCCMARKPLTEGSRSFNVNEDRVAEIWGSDALHAVKQAMLENRKVPECEFCYENEASYGTSYRHYHNSLWFDDYDAFRRRLAEDPAVASRLEAEHPWHVHLVLGNQCNLKCRMCSSSYSSGIENDPVHRQWAPALVRNDTRTVRWSGQTAVIGPRPRVGVVMDGLWDWHQIAGREQRWTRGAARIVFPILDGTKPTRLRLSLWEHRPEDQAVRIAINGRTVHDGPLPAGPWTGEFDLAGSALGHELVLEIAADLQPNPVDYSTGHAALQSGLPAKGEPVGVAIEEIALERSADSTGGVVPGGVLAGRFSSPGKWFEQDSLLWGEIFRDPASLRLLNITGGEPFLIRQTEAILDYLIDLDAAPHVRLMFSTNATEVSDELIRKLSRFEQVMFNLSLDGTGEVLEYIRFGASWSRIEQNIRRLATLPNATLTATPTVQVYNLLALPQLFEWCELNGVAIQPNPLHGPRYLSVLTLPQSIREEAADRLEAWMRRSFVPENQDRVGGLIGLLRSGEDQATERQWKDFVEFTNDLDQSRGQDIKTALPELVSLLEAAGQTWHPGTRHARSGSFAV